MCPIGDEEKDRQKTNVIYPKIQVPCRMDVYVSFCWPKWADKSYRNRSVFWKLHLNVHKYLDVMVPFSPEDVPSRYYHRLSHRTCRCDIDGSVSYRLRLSDTLHYKVGSIFWGPVLLSTDAGSCFSRVILNYVLGRFKNLSLNILNCYPNQIVGVNHPHCDFSHDFCYIFLATKRETLRKFNSLHLNSSRLVFQPPIFQG